jgi:hypothetical protein
MLRTKNEIQKELDKLPIRLFGSKKHKKLIKEYIKQTEFYTSQLKKTIDSEVKIC